LQRSFLAFSATDHHDLYYKMHQCHTVIMDYVRVLIVPLIFLQFADDPIVILIDFNKMANASDDR
jgi:hypothetical protein